MNKIREYIEITKIYDLYAVLLTDKQREVFELYYMENLSLQEIADESNVSKASVHNLLNRTKANLLEYEYKLKLLEESNRREDLVDEIKLILKKEQIKNEKLYALIEKI